MREISKNLSSKIQKMFFLFIILSILSIHSDSILRKKIKDSFISIDSHSASNHNSNLNSILSKHKKPKPGEIIKKAKLSALLAFKDFHAHLYNSLSQTPSLMKRSDDDSMIPNEMQRKIEKEIKLFSKEIRQMERLLEDQKKEFSELSQEDPSKTDLELWIEITTHELQLNVAYKEQLEKVAYILKEYHRLAKQNLDPNALHSERFKLLFLGGDSANTMDSIQNTAKQSTLEWLEHRLAMQQVEGRSQERIEKSAQWIQMVKTHPNKFELLNVGRIILGFHKKYPSLDTIIKHGYISKLPSKDTVVMGSMLVLSALAIGMLTKSFMNKEKE